jgi:hypothetical protein
MAKVAKTDLHTEHPQDDATPAGLHHFEKQEQQRQHERERNDTNDVTGHGGRDGEHGENRRFAQEYAGSVKHDIYAEVEKSAVRGFFAKNKNSYGDESDGQENCADSNGKNCPAPFGVRESVCCCEIRKGSWLELDNSYTRASPLDKVYICTSGQENSWTLVSASQSR